MGVRSQHILTFIEYKTEGCSLEQYAATLVALQEEIGDKINMVSHDLKRAGKEPPYAYEEEEI
jgi:hypothetical protein